MEDKKKDGIDEVVEEVKEETEEKPVVKDFVGTIDCRSRLGNNNTSGTQGLGSGA